MAHQPQSAKNWCISYRSSINGKPQIRSDIRAEDRMFHQSNVRTALVPIHLGLAQDRSVLCIYRTKLVLERCYSTSHCASYRSNDTGPKAKDHSNSRTWHQDCRKVLKCFRRAEFHDELRQLLGPRRKTYCILQLQIKMATE